MTTTNKKKTSKNKKTDLKVMKGGKKKTKKAFDEAAFCKKYPWVVKGSIKEVEPGTVVDDVTVAHGRICKIKCQETGKLRTVNVQDAFQTKYTKEVQKRKSRERASKRRNTKKKTNTKKKAK